MKSFIITLLVAAAFTSGPPLEKAICLSSNTALVRIAKVHTDPPFTEGEFGRLVIIDAEIEQMIHGDWDRKSFKGERIRQLRFLAYIDFGMPFEVDERYVMNYVHQSNGIRFFDVGGAWQIVDEQIVGRRISLENFIVYIGELRKNCSKING